MLARRIRRQLGDALLRIQRANFRPRAQGLIEQRLFFERGEIVEIQVVGNLKVLIARQIEQRGQAVLGGVRQRFGVNQILPLVLQFHVGAHRVYIQTDAGFLQFAGLLVQPLRQRDADVRGVARGQSAQNQQVLIHHRVYHDFARGLFVGARLVRAFAADLVSANLLEVQDGLRKSGTGFDDLEGAKPCAALGRVRCFGRCIDLSSQFASMFAWGSSAERAIWLLRSLSDIKQLSDHALRILFQRELHGLFQRELQRARAAAPAGCCAKESSGAAAFKINKSRTDNCRRLANL